MIEQIINSYLNDEPEWVPYGDELYAKSMDEIRPLLDTEFWNSFTESQEYHDWRFESFLTTFTKQGIDVEITLSDNDYSFPEDEQDRVKIEIKRCSGFRVENGSTRPDFIPEEVLIIAFEKNKNTCIGFGLSSGMTIYVYCDISAIRLKKLKENRS